MSSLCAWLLLASPMGMTSIFITSPASIKMERRIAIIAPGNKVAETMARHFLKARDLIQSECRKNKWTWMSRLDYPTPADQDSLNEARRTLAQSGYINLMALTCTFVVSAKETRLVEKRYLFLFYHEGNRNHLAAILPLTSQPLTGDGASAPSPTYSISCRK